jgi:hypothetical protein
MDSVSTGNRMVYAYPPLNTTHSLLQIITTLVSSIIHDEHGFILICAARPRAQGRCTAMYTEDIRKTKGLGVVCRVLEPY